MAKHTGTEQQQEEAEKTEKIKIMNILILHFNYKILFLNKELQKKADK